MNYAEDKRATIRFLQKGQEDRSTLRADRALTFLFILVLAVSAPSPRLLAQQTSGPSTSGTKSEISLHSERLTETTDGITREQADAILAELREIRRLLERQQAQAAPSIRPPARVLMPVDATWRVLGRQDAPVTIVEFIDLQCPFCRRFETDVFPQIEKEYINTGKARFVTRDLPLRVHPYAQKAAEAVRCAGDQGKFWGFRKAILTGSETLNEDSVRALAESLHLDLDAFRGCFEQGKHEGDVQTDVDQAASLQINATPTFVVARTTKDVLDGQRMAGAQSFSAFRGVIDSLLTEQPKVAKPQSQ